MHAAKHFLVTTQMTLAREKNIFERKILHRIVAGIDFNELFELRNPFGGSYYKFIWMLLLNFNSNKISPTHVLRGF